MASSHSIEVPDGFTLHTENTSHILLSSNEAFLNPVQEFNRDISVACIRTWSDDLNTTKEEKWKRNQEKRLQRGSKKRFKGEDSELVGGSTEPPETDVAPGGHPRGIEIQYQPYKFTLLEALSATGLRSIRYAKELPHIKYVIANDLSPTAVAAMNRNITINDLVDTTEGVGDPSQPPIIIPGKVRINEGDACSLMYNHREEKNRVDVVDLDPYGTAAPFIDAAVQCVKDEGLLCVTCTDLSVLATTNYPEKCFSNYGGVPVKAEYCHEAASFATGASFAFYIGCEIWALYHAFVVFVH